MNKKVALIKKYGNEYSAHIPDIPRHETGELQSKCIYKDKIPIETPNLFSKNGSRIV